MVIQVMSLLGFLTVIRLKGVRTGLKLKKQPCKDSNLRKSFFKFLNRTHLNRNRSAYISLCMRVFGSPHLECGKVGCVPLATKKQTNKQ